jgi:hypothetical protein
MFQQIVTQTPDPEIEKSNASHKAFIDALDDSYKALGGEDWEASQESSTVGTLDEDLEEVIFANTFESLGMYYVLLVLFSSLNVSHIVVQYLVLCECLTLLMSIGLGEVDDANDDEDEESATEEAPSRPKQTKKKAVGRGKGKKGKRGKKAKGKAAPAVKELTLDDIALESYRIIEDQDGMMTDYLMAVYALVQQWIELRHYVQGLWREVAYGGLNSAVAGTMSNIAIAMVKQTETSIFVEFPGHESYETVMNTITRGDPEKAQGMFKVTLHRMGEGSGKAEQVEETAIDIREQFLIHAYWDLLAFVTDFQKARSGKPTKPMMAQIRDWDPKFNLKNGTCSCIHSFQRRSVFENVANFQLRYTINTNSESRQLPRINASNGVGHTQ